MPGLYLYIILFTGAFLYINFNFISVKRRVSIDQQKNIRIIEQLSKYSSKPRNYRTPPENYRSTGCGISGELFNEEGIFSYKFPLIDRHHSVFRHKVHAQNFSSVLSQFGVSTALVTSKEKNFYLVMDQFGNLPISDMNRYNEDGLYFRHPSWGTDYNHIINISKEIGVYIAHHIVSELQRIGQDNYVNRVRAVLNFVQYIPYGVPNFDTEQHTYMGVALPHESIAISYSDCDSKSCLFASILLHMIATENIVLVGCEAKDGGGHMIVGVSDLPYPGQKYKAGNKEYLLIETTVPHPIGYLEEGENINLELIKLTTS